MVESTGPSELWSNLYDPLRRFGQRVSDWFSPRSEASAIGNYYEIDVELPGVKAEDVEVSIHDNSLMIKGTKKSERQESGRNFFFSEIEYGEFQRSFRLPADASIDKIDADIRDGVLRLRIAKEDQSKPAGRKIEVRKS